MEPSAFLDATGKPLERLPDVIRPGTNAVIFNDRREVLLERRSDFDVWGLPGGAVDVGESVEQAVLREVLEETGLQVKVKRLVGIYSDPRQYSIVRYPSGQMVQYVTSVFECERETGELRISPESTDIGYFSLEALPENMLPAHLVRIKDGAANQRTPFIK